MKPLAFLAAYLIGGVAFDAIQRAEDRAHNRNIWRPSMAALWPIMWGLRTLVRLAFRVYYVVFKFSHRRWLDVVLICGFRRETLVVTKADPRHLAALGVLETYCPECLGTGDWGRFMPEPTPEPCPCVGCKGTGMVYIGG